VCRGPETGLSSASDGSTGDLAYLRKATPKLGVTSRTHLARRVVGEDEYMLAVALFTRAECQA